MPSTHGGGGIARISQAKVVTTKNRIIISFSFFLPCNNIIQQALARSTTPGFNFYLQFIYLSLVETFMVKLKGDYFIIGC